MQQLIALILIQQEPNQEVTNMKIVVAFVLLLYASGDMIEHVGPYTLSECLSMKRQIERNGWKDRNNTRYTCEERTVEIGEDWQGEIQVIKVLPRESRLDYNR